MPARMQCEVPRHGTRLVVAALLATALSGCGGPQRASPVDKELARDTLTRVLEHWKNGGNIRDFRDQTPEIVVQEVLWSGNRKLASYALTGEARAQDANWFCEVELTLAPENGGKPTTKKVTYAVGTDPVITVFRAMF